MKVEREKVPEAVALGRRRAEKAGRKEMSRIGRLGGKSGKGKSKPRRQIKP